MQKIKNLLQQYNKLTPAQKQQYVSNFESGNLSEKQFNDYKNLFGGQGGSYENYVKIYVSNTEKILETFLSIFDLIKLSLTFKKGDEVQHDHGLINEEINLDERI